MLCDYFAGWVSGVVSLVIGHPLDTIKIQQQVVGITFTEAASRIVKHRGWKGFYRGILVPVLANGTLNAVFFGVYGDVRDYLINTRYEREWKLEKSLESFGNHASERQKQMLEDEVHRRMALAGFEETNPKRPNQVISCRMTYITAPKIRVGDMHVRKYREAKFSELFISGALAGISCLFLAVPAELVKTKLQSQMKRKQFRGPIHCFMTIVQESGFRGIYRGIIPMALRESFAGGSYFIVYETIKRKSKERKSAFASFLVQAIGGGLAVGAGVNILVLCQFLKSCKFKDALSNPLKLLLDNGVAGIAAWSLILPFDTIKSRMQADNHLNPQYKNMAHCAKTVLKTDGIRGLYRGFWSCLARAVPVNVIIFVVYEMIQERIC